MATRPLRPCAQPGCPRLVQSGYCDEHRRPTRVHDPEQRKFYSSARWRKISLQVRREQPLCAECSFHRSAVCDHIDGDWRNNARENLRGLCRDCDARISGAQHRRKRGRGGG